MTDDDGSIKSVKAPEGVQLRLPCGPNKRIQVSSALYSSDADESNQQCGKDTLSVVRKLCQNKNSCSFQVSNRILGEDPCGPNRKKTLKIKYICASNSDL